MLRRGDHDVHAFGRGDGGVFEIEVAMDGSRPDVSWSMVLGLHVYAALRTVPLRRVTAQMTAAEATAAAHHYCVSRSTLPRS